MCCAIEYPQIQRKMGMTDGFKFSYNALPKKQMKAQKEEEKYLPNTEGTECLSFHLKSGDWSCPDVPKVNTEDEDKEAKKEQKRKKKWKPLQLTECGFNLSLFPRPTRPERIDPEAEAEIWAKIESEIQDYDAMVEKYKHFDTTNTEQFDVLCATKDKYFRVDRHRKIRKAGRQVKDKYCTSLKNNKGRKKLYIHHRLFKLINLEEKRLFLHLPSNPAYKESDVISRNNKSSNETRSRLKPYSATPSNPRPAPVQNLRFALQQSNAAADLASDLVNILINLQHRELTPEDYELLLRLDDSVAPKTIHTSLLSNFKTDTVDDNSAGDVCAVCMDLYEIGQNRKFLPCNHVFHAKCIDMWLENSSRNCPIDGLPVDEHS